MKQTRYSRYTRWMCKWLFLLCLGMLPAVWGGCTDEVTTPGEQGEITFQLSLPPALEVTTRGGNLGGAAIEDVWVLQYDATTKVFIMGKNFSGNAIGDLETNQTIKVTTSKFANTASNFYIIVNAGTTYLEDFIKETTPDRSEVALKKKTINITPGEATQPKLLTCGPLPYTPDGSSGLVVLVAPLLHPCAHISVQWSKPTDFEGTIDINSVIVKNLPTYMALYSRGGGSLSSTYPTSTAVTGSATLRSTSLSSGTLLPFYMGENLRGTGTATSFQEKGLEGKGPGQNGTLAGCTCVVLAGDYKYSGSYTGIVKVEYCIYLGGNLLKDYNIQRGYKYDLTVNIIGINSADVRVTITDGAVVVFDDVETITKIVEFR